MKALSRLTSAVAAVALIATPLPAAAQQAQAPAQGVQQSFVYFYDQRGSADFPMAGGSPTPDESDVFDGCREAEAQIAPFLVPLAIFGFNLFARVVEARLAAAERRRLRSLSASYAAVSSADEFVVAPEQQRRCLVVERVARMPDNSFQQGAVYVFMLRGVGNNGFTIEPVAAQISASNIYARERREEMNATVSMTVQSVIARNGINELVTLPSYSATFEGLTPTSVVRPPRRASPVFPLIQRAGATGRAAVMGIPTSVVVAVTESHARLDRVKEEIALEQANRAALVAAIGESLKTAITD